MSCGGALKGAADGVEFGGPSSRDIVLHRSAHRVRRAVAELPLEFREVLILREFQDHSYKHISEITGTPIGTVMSRLARARQRLQSILLQQREAGVL